MVSSTLSLVVVFMAAVALVIIKVLLENGRAVRLKVGVAPKTTAPLNSTLDFFSQELQLGSDYVEQDTDELRIVSRGDIAVQYGWNTAPIVVREYNLLFFTVPKVACSVFKKLFRRMKGYDDWLIPNGWHSTHNPKTNGLEYLFQVPLSEAEEMMTSPNWTRAIFLRDPKDRLLSAYLDKGVHSSFIVANCCRRFRRNPAERRVCESQVSTFPGFVERAKICRNEHWKPFSKRLDEKHWSYINFFGQFASLATDAERLLQMLGGDAWDKYGKAGWGHYGNESIFNSPATNHTTNSSSKYAKYYEPALEKEVEQLYKDDYKMFNFTNR